MKYSSTILLLLLFSGSAYLEQRVISGPKHYSGMAISKQSFGYGNFSAELNATNAEGVSQSFGLVFEGSMAN